MRGTEIGELGTELPNQITANFSELPFYSKFNLFLKEYGDVISAVYKAEKQINLAERIITKKMIDNSDKQPSEKTYLILAGAGTPGRRAQQEAAEMYPTFGVNEVLAINAGGLEALTKSIEGAEDDYEQGRIDIFRIAKPRDIVFGISSSGRTPYVIGVLDRANEIRCYTISLSNNRNSIVYQKANLGIFIDTGEEIITGSTRLKADLSHKIVLNFLTTSVMANLGYVQGNIMNNVQPNSNKLKIRLLAVKIYNQFGIDYEEALKISELLLRNNNFDLEKVKKGINLI